MITDLWVSGIIMLIVVPSLVILFTCKVMIR